MGVTTSFAAECVFCWGLGVQGGLLGRTLLSQCRIREHIMCVHNEGPSQAFELAFPLPACFCMLLIKPRDVTVTQASPPPNTIITQTCKKRCLCSHFSTCEAL